MMARSRSCKRDPGCARDIPLEIAGTTRWASMASGYVSDTRVRITGLRGRRRFVAMVGDEAAQMGVVGEGRQKSATGMSKMSRNRTPKKT